MQSCLLCCEHPTPAPPATNSSCSPLVNVVSIQTPSPNNYQSPGEPHSLISASCSWWIWCGDMVPLFCWVHPPVLWLAIFIIIGCTFRQVSFWSMSFMSVSRQKCFFVPWVLGQSPSFQKCSLFMFIIFTNKIISLCQVFPHALQQK